MINDLILGLQDLAARVPDLVQPLIVALAAMIPFVEGELAVFIGVVAGIPPVVATIAAIAGNFLIVALVFLVSERARTAVTSRRRKGQGGDTLVDEGSARSTQRRERFERVYHRFGVPGVALLGPLLLPTHFSAAALAATGAPRVRSLVWLGVSIVVRTVLFGLIATGIVSIAL